LTSSILATTLHRTQQSSIQKKYARLLKSCAIQRFTLAILSHDKIAGVTLLCVADASLS